MALKIHPSISVHAGRWLMSEIIDRAAAASPTWLQRWVYRGKR